MESEFTQYRCKKTDPIIHISVAHHSLPIFKAVFRHFQFLIAVSQVGTSLEKDRKCVSLLRHKNLRRKVIQTALLANDFVWFSYFS